LKKKHLDIVSKWANTDKQRDVPAMENMMLDSQEAERLNRIEALANAVRHRLREESPDEVVIAAQKYFNFLQGNSAEKLCSCKVA
jgi:hypothetical protein